MMIRADAATLDALYRTRGLSRHAYLIVPRLSVSGLRRRIEGRAAPLSTREAWLLARMKRDRSAVLLQVVERVRQGSLKEIRRYVLVDPGYLLRPIKTKPTAMRLGEA